MKYRAEIDGLRALAVFPVILFHAGYGMFSGGFVGVDIFLVISGYLITTIILREIEEGRFSIAKFYERRARRILPALYFIIILSIPVAWLTLPPDLLENFGQSVAATVLFSNNILLYVTSSYWGAASELKPLLHTWSLAIEEQYYILFPLFLISTWRFGKTTVVQLLFLFFFVSLALSHWGAYNKPTATFFLLHTRLWEIVLGVFCAFYLIKKHDHDSKPLEEVLSLFGLFLIIFSIFAFNETTPSPSFYTLAPTVGTALVILFANKGTFTNKFLRQRLLVGVGLISYSSYLWHQTLFAFYRTESIWLDQDKTDLPALITLSFLMGYLSWRFVERPFRTKEKFSRKTIFSLSISTAILLAGIGVSMHFGEGFYNRAKDFTSLEIDTQRDLDQECIPLNISNDFKACKYGNKNSSPPKLALIGDSHAKAIVPVLASLSEEDGSSFLLIYNGGCPPLIGVNVELELGDRDMEGCLKLAQAQLDYIKKEQIKNVLLAARWSLYTSGDYTWRKKSHFLTSHMSKEISKQNTLQVFESSLSQTIKSYKSLGTEVSILMQVPQQKYPAEYMYYQLSLRGKSNEERDKAIKRNSVSFMEHARLQKENRDIFETLKTELEFRLINPDEMFCNKSGECPIGTISESYYVDEDHLDINGALKLKPFLISIMQD